MNYREYKNLVISDLYRITERTDISSLLKQIFFGCEFKYIFWMRACNFSSKKRLLKVSLYPIFRIILNHYKYKFCISIPHDTKIGEGFFISHFGGIVVNKSVVIGKNCNISQGVTIGYASRGDRKGCATIGDHVYIGPGAKIVGAIRIGNNVAIGANCVVTKDVPDNSVIVGIPGKVISNKGSIGYINKTLNKLT